VRTLNHVSTSTGSIPGRKLHVILDPRPDVGRLAGRDVVRLPRLPRALFASTAEGPRRSRSRAASSSLSRRIAARNSRSSSDCPCQYHAWTMSEASGGGPREDVESVERMRRGGQRTGSCCAEATRVSTAVDRLLLQRRAVRGHVLTVSRTVVNLVSGDAILAVGTFRSGMPPQGIELDNQSARLLEVVREGQEFRAGKNWVTIGDRVTVCLNDGSRWSPSLPKMRISGWRGLAHRATALDRHLQAAGRSGFTLPVDAGRQLRAFEVALASGDLETMIEAGGALVGLGAGLTPAGDDLLVGFTAALAAIELCTDSVSEALAVAWASQARSRTTPVAASFYAHAAAGEYAEPIAAALRTVLSGPTNRVQEAVEQAGTWGATSGLDMLQGVALGIRLVAQRCQFGRVGRPSLDREDTLPVI